MRLILASRSPRRIDILRAMGLDPVVVPADLEDDPDGRTSGSARLTVLRLAARKAEAVVGRLADEGAGGGGGGGSDVAAGVETLVLAADTVVVLDGTILHKPTDAAEAREMLGELSGRVHEVLTGVCVTRAGARESWLHAARTLVRFRELSDDTIARYVATGSPLDKAGAYGIQDDGAEFPLVEQIEGDYWNVVGLPTEVVREGLAHFGVACEPLRRPSPIAG